MERLTERCCTGGIRIRCCSTIYPDTERKTDPASNAIVRLAAYEDIMTLERAQEFSKAEKDGRLLKYIPGDKVYDRFGTSWIVESSEIHLIGAEIKHLYRCGHSGTGDYCAMYEEEVRKREETEETLKKKEAENGSKADKNGIVPR